MRKRRVTVLGSVILACAVLLVPAAADQSPQPGRAGAGSPERALLHVDLAQVPRGLDFVTVATAADGRRIRTYGVGDARSAVWAPDGTRFAALAPSPTADGVLKVFDPDGRSTTIFEAAPGEVVMGWAPAWSPDGRYLAVAVLRDPPTPTADVSFFAIIVDVAAGTVRSREAIPAGTLRTRHLSPPDAFRWSPDGRSILVSWERAVVLDLERRAAHIVSEGPVVADWTPDGDVLYFEVDNVRGRPGAALGGLYVMTLPSRERRQLADTAELVASGIALHTGMHHGLIGVSPSGASVAVVQGVPGSERSALRVYALPANGAIDLAMPREVIDLDGDIVVKLDWSPDEQRLAALTIPASATSRQGPFGRPAIRVLTLASRAWHTVTALNLDLRVEWPQSLELLLLERGVSWTR